MKYKVKLLLKDNNETSDEEYIANYPQLENNIIRKGRGWNDSVCFSYALDTLNIYCCEDAYEILINYYYQIKNRDIKEGDIIVYFDWTKEIEHFAKVYETDGTIKGTIIRSKWGSLGVYETTIFGIPNIYGCHIEIWRDKKGG